MRISRGHLPGAASKRRSRTFTGNVWADSVLNPEDGVTVGTVLFEPGACTFWHRHEGGQVLLVTHGEGQVVVRDGDRSVVGPGDIVHCPAGEEHWHGATATTFMVHTTISLGGTEWLAEVTEDEWLPDGAKGEPAGVDNTPAAR